VSLAKIFAAMSLLRMITPECAARAADVIIEANVAQDPPPWMIIPSLFGLRKHYNRAGILFGLFSDPQAADRAYGDYLLEAEAEFDNDLGAGKCEDALKALGRQSHAWQDLYRHAIGRSGSWIVWGWDRTVNPFNRSRIYPSTFPFGQHWPWEPVLPRDELELRRQGAVLTSTIGFGVYLADWWWRCSCWCQNP
jgi:hypothetical protein